MAEQSPSESTDIVQEVLHALNLTDVPDDQIERLAQFIITNSHEGPALRAAGPMNESSESSPRSRLRWTGLTRGIIVALLWLLSMAGEGLAFRHLMTVEQEEWTPDHVQASENDRIMYLVARNGRKIHAWGTPVPMGIRAGVFVPRNESADRGDMAIIGYSQDSENAYPHSFAAFHVKDDPEHPTWTVALTTSDIPQDLRARPDRTYDPLQFAAVTCVAADIFADLPGSELILVFQHSVYSQCAVQIRDLDGKLLSQFWHDGNINQIYWMAVGSQIVCAGFNSEVDGSDRGLPHRWHPRVVFSVTPQLSQTTPRWVNTVDHQGGIQPNWYLCILGPIVTPEDSDVRLSRPFAGQDARSHVAVALDFRTAGELSGFSVLLDSSGAVVGGSLLTNDPFNNALKRGVVPPAESFRFDALPAIQHREGLWIPGVQPEQSASAPSDRE